MRRARGAVLGAAQALALAVALADCAGGDASAPREGTAIAFALETSRDDTGALLVEVTGGPVDSVHGASHVAVYISSPTGESVRALVTGELAPGPVFIVFVPDARLASGYTALVTQAAARGTYELRDPQDFHLARR